MPKYPTLNFSTKQFLKGVLYIGHVSKQRLFIPDLLLVDKPQTSGALHNSKST